MFNITVLIFFFCLDESMDITTSDHLAFTVQFTRDNEICEELFKLAILSRTTEHDIYCAAVNTIQILIQIFPKSFVITDGTPSMTGIKAGFVISFTKYE